MPIIERSPHKEFDLSGKVAIVTGSSRGIGRAIALKLGFYGVNVVINSTDKSIPQAEEVKSSIEGFGRKAIVVTGNICEEETAKNIVSRTISEFGRIDILVNNAGIRNDGLLIKMFRRNQGDFIAPKTVEMNGAILRKNKEKNRPCQTKKFWNFRK